MLDGRNKKRNNDTWWQWHLDLRHLAGTGCIRWSKRTIWNVDLPPQLFFLRAAVLPRWPLTSANLIYQMKVYSNALMGLLLSHGNTNMNSWVRDVSDSGEMHINKNCYTHEVWQEEKYNKNALLISKVRFHFQSFDLKHFPK